jgi:zinc transporter 2
LNSAFLHALGDCVQSVGVICSALFIWIGNYNRYGAPSSATSVYNLADPLSSIFFGVITLYWTRPLMMELVGILMESTPPGIDANEVAQKLWQIPGVVGVHDLHIWSLTAEKPSLSVHLVATNHVATLEQAQKICESFGISHHTIQVDDVDVGEDRCGSNIGCASSPFIAPEAAPKFS